MKLSTIIERGRFPSPAAAPQALAWSGGKLWMGSRDLRRIYAIDSTEWKGLEEKDPPGFPWAAVATNGSLCFTIGEDPNDDRYIRRFVPKAGFSETDRIACPEFTGSYLSFDGEHLYLSQWYKHRIMKFDGAGKVLSEIDVGAEVCGHVCVNGMMYVLRGVERPQENWRISRFDLREQKSEINDIA